MAAHHLSGTIYNAHDGVLENVIIQAFDQDFRKQEQLGEATTDAMGVYKISYDTSIFAEAENGSADVFIRVLDAAGAFLGQSEIHFNVAEEFVLDFKLDNAAVRKPDEFSALVEKIKPLIDPQRVPLGKLEENGQYKDISFLAGELSVYAEMISFVNSAFKLSEETNIAADIFYGLFRMSYPVEINRLLLISSQSILKALKQAIDENIISSRWSNELDNVIRALNGLAVKQMISDNGHQPAAFKKLMGGVLSADQQIIFAETYLANENEPGKFWEHLAQQPGFNGDSIIEKSKQALHLNIVTGNQPELSNLLVKAQENDEELKNTAGFAKYNKADWKEKIREAGLTDFPQWVGGTTPGEKTDYYATALEDLHKELYPTPFFAQRLKRDPQSSFLLKDELEIFFNRNPEFDLKTNSIHKQLDASSFDSVLNIEGVKKDLKTLNRLYKITEDYEAVNALHGKELYSATDIVSKYGEEQFKKHFADAAGGISNAADIYAKANSISNKASALLTSYKMRHDVKLFAIDGTSQAPVGYHEMFGEGELCECEHCQSVYSPAAYFVDMLAFIKRENEEAYTELLRRRPDLDDILLTCKNTNTPLPYIDLVNELLEKETVKISSLTDTESITGLAHSYQTEGNAEELAAMPEHVSAVAYTALQNLNDKAVFSATLPLDLPLEEVRIYSEKLGWERYQLIEQFYGHNEPGKYIHADLAAELLKFTPSELKIINGTTPFSVSMQTNVKEFLDYTKLSYIGLLQLLETGFLNPKTGDQRKIKITQELADDDEAPLLTCNLEKLTITGADDAWLNKMVRFVRLQKKLEWNIFDLDRALLAIGLTDFPAAEALFNTELLLPLSHIERLKRTLNLSLSDCLVFIANIDTANYADHSKDGQPVIPSLYEQIFRNKTVSNLNDSPFKENAENLSGSLADHQALICAVLGIPASDFSSMTGVGEPLSLNTLSRLYRTILISKTLKTSISDLQKIIAITGRTPSDEGWGSVTLLEFLDEWKLFKSAGITATEFYSLFVNKIGSDYKLPVNEVLIDFIGQNQTGFTEIANDTNLTEAQRNEQFIQKIVLFMQELEVTAMQVTSFGNDSLIHKDDLVIKAAIGDYLGDQNKEMLQMLPHAEFINKLSNLKRTLEEYLLMKTAPLVFRKLGFSPAKIQWLKNRKAETGTEILWNEPVDTNSPELYPGFRRLLHLSRLNNLKTDGQLSWTALLDIAINNPSKPDFFNAFVNLYDVDVDSLVFLAGSGDEINNKGRLNLTFPEDYCNNVEFLHDILHCCKLTDRVGDSSKQMQSLLSMDVAAIDAENVNNLLKSRYGSKEWLNIIKPVSDQLRTKRRDALVAWLLAETDNIKWQDSSDIYETLLIDVEMSACMLTSRIKQAIGTVQLFIDRCLMSLETIANTETTDPDDVKTIILGEKFSRQWNSWRKLEQFWTANRKVFLYPENWIEPDLRDGKSPFFKELESQLNQNEVTEETVKEALLIYLEKLDTVSNLEVAGLYNEEENKIVHVIGRTPNIPHQYFYRKQQNAHWSAWEKVDVDIEGNHILPVVWNGRLMLFWALFTEKQQKGGGSTSINKSDGDSMTMTSTPPEKYIEMKLAWTENKKGKWVAKKLSKESIICINHQLDNLVIPGMESVDGKENTDYLSLNSSFDNGKLLIHLFNVHTEYSSVRQNQVQSSFSFNSCNSSPSLTKAYQNIAAKIPSRMAYSKMFIDGLLENNINPFALYTSGTYWDENLNSGSAELSILLKNPSSFHLLPDHHEIEKDKPETFFYKNEQNNFYVHSKEFRKPVTGDFSVDNAGVLMSRRSVSPVNTSSALLADANGTILHRTLPLITDHLNPDLLNGVNEVIEPVRVFFGKKYLFQTFYHPDVCSYVKRLNTKGIDDLYREEVQPLGFKEIFTSVNYNPNSNYVLTPYPKEQLDFSFGGAYSLYNWELFFHIPLLIAARLSQNQQFEAARHWFHYIFDPTKSSAVAGSERFWITKPFKEEVMAGTLTLEELLENVEHSDDLNAQLDYWEKNPFNPHGVARLRISAYMRNTVLKYIDNLIAWGDQLFKRDTIESINEATLLYVLASSILGRKQVQVPAKGLPEEKSFSDIGEQLDRFSNAKVEVESFISPSSSGEAGDDIRMSYFCLPKNDKLLKYWDTISDRLFKIRHCQNMDGVFRQLPLFEPPIDPALLVKANAAGLDLSSILNDINISLPHYRFHFMLQKANEFCSDVRAFGSSLLSVLEKKDSEELAMIHSMHELKMLGMIKLVKEKQRDEGRENLDSLLKLRETTEERQSYYNRNLAANLNNSERTYFNSSNSAIGIQRVIEIRNYLASVLHLVPDGKVGSGFTIGATYGGGNLGRAESAGINALHSVASLYRIEAELANMKGLYDRRADEWKFQAKSAELELRQIDKQILAAEIRLAITEKELENHDLQKEQSEEVNSYLRGKFTNEELYDWMIKQTFTVYSECYKLAHTTAKKAEKCMQYELGLERTNYIQPDNWDSLKKGLLSGEKLQYDLRRLENAYLEENKREYELTKHISLAMLDPFALIQLRSTGTCSFEIPELVYDMDYAGHYLRRIKSLSLSLPCIAGPFTSVSATLKLTNSKCRVKNELSESNLKPFGKDQSIAASNAQNDSGVFELNFRDERYLPFEGAGAISSWTLELPTEIRQFDYETIPDVVMHVKYTAREGGSSLKSQVNAQLKAIKQGSTQEEFQIAINLKHDLPNEWHQLQKNGQVNLRIDKTRLPYMAQALNAAIGNVIFVASVKDDPAVFTINADNVDIDLSKVDEFNLYQGNSVNLELDKSFLLSISDTDLPKLEQLILIVKYIFQS